MIVTPAGPPTLGTAAGVVAPPSGQAAPPTGTHVGNKRQLVGATRSAASGRRASRGKARRGASPRETAAVPAAALGEPTALGGAPIDVDVPLGGQPASQLLYIPESTLKQVVAAAVAPLRIDIAMTRKDVKEMKGTLGQVRQTVDAQGQSIDRMAGGLTSVNDKIEKGTADVPDVKKNATEDKGGPDAVQVRKMALANKNFNNMEAARSVFKQRMKEDMGLTDISTRVYPSGAVSYEDSVRAIKEVHSMNDKDANAYALSVRIFPRRDKASVKEMRVSALIVSIKSHFGQQLKAKVLMAWCPIAGVKLPAKRKRQTKGQKHRLATSPTAKASKKGTNSAAKTSSRKLSTAKRAALNKNQSATAMDKKERAVTATKWLKDDAYAKTPTGFKALMAAVEQQLLFLGVPERVIKPKNVGEVKYNCCTMGHVGLPAAIIRDYLEKEAGVRSRRRCGVADGMYEQFAAELRRLHKWLPTDGTMKDGLLLVDGASKNRCTFEADAADAVAKARLLNTENQAASKAGAASDGSDDGSGCDGEGEGADKLPCEGSELEKEEIDLEEAGFGIGGGGGAGGSVGAVDDEEGGDDEGDEEGNVDEGDEEGNVDDGDDDEEEDEDDDVDDDDVVEDILD